MLGMKRVDRGVKRTTPGRRAQTRSREIDDPESTVMRVSCPKCTSTDVRQVSQVHGSEPASLSKLAAPPAKRRWAVWAAVSVACAIPAIATARQPGLGTLIMTGLSALMAGFAFNAWTFNARVHPVLLDRWQHSLMCLRCGQMFTAP